MPWTSATRIGCDWQSNGAIAVPASAEAIGTRTLSAHCDKRVLHRLRPRLLVVVAVVRCNQSILCTSAT